MGKKKKGGGKKKAGAEDDGELNPDGLAAKMLFAENFSLKRQLAERREDALLAISQRKQLQAQIEDLKRDFEREEKSTYAITADMTRQYKDMQGELIKRINGAENTITELKDQLELERAGFITTVHGFDTHHTFDDQTSLHFDRMNSAITTFKEEMVAQNMWDNVAVLLVSDFGRTVKTKTW